MGVNVEMRGLERMLTSGVGDSIARETVAKLVARGLQIAKTYAQITSPELGASIHADPITTQDDITTGGFGTSLDFGPYVEFGTGRPGQEGLVKNGQERNPKADRFTYTLQTTIRSGPNQGKLRPGWVYHSETHGFVHTLGQPASPFMYPAQLQLENDAAEIAGAAVRDNIRKA